MGCIVFSDDGVGSRYVSLVLFYEGLDLFSPLVESPFWPLVILPAVANWSFQPPRVMANGGVKSYRRFNLQMIWLMCF
jgi:hypothetical protein